jgi:hypothetical protein
VQGVQRIFIAAGEDDADKRSVLNPKYHFYQQPDPLKYRIDTIDKRGFAQSKEKYKNFKFFCVTACRLLRVPTMLF